MSYEVLARKLRPSGFDALVGQEHVVRALSHALDNGRLHHAYLFTGTRGVGKTTILRLIAGLYTAAVFDGQIKASDSQPLDGRIAYMAQTDLLLPWASVLDNVCLGAYLRGQTADKDKAEAIIARVGLTAHKQKKPATLSGGQRQRAALARTLMEDRPIVLLDEPFSALDSPRNATTQGDFLGPIQTD